MPSIVIVSNRLPVSVKKTEDGLEFRDSDGGLASSLRSYMTRGTNKWIGWPGIPSEELDDKDKRKITRELKKRNCYPLFLTKNQVNNFYNHFSNEQLWPAFHDMPVTGDFKPSHWQAYKDVNGLFTEAVLALTTANSTIWVHDYQLLLMPQMLRAERPDAQIGLFMHTPFATGTNLSDLPHVKQLVHGMLGANLIGFQTEHYVQAFKDGVNALKIAAVSDNAIVLPDRAIQVGTHPISIDYQKFASAAKARSVKKQVRQMRRKYGRRKIIVTVDRLEPTKGFLQRLKAYRQFLRANPKLHNKVMMVMLAIPSRMDLPEYQKLKADVDKLIASINDEFGTSKWQPIEYNFRTMPFEELTALYQVGDIAFVTPLKDGMNLVAKEYVASQRKRNGVLILSHGAGAAQELTDAVLVDPRSPKSLLAGLEQAVTMPKRELKARIEAMQKHIAVNTIDSWTKDFIHVLRTPINLPVRRTHTLAEPDAKIMVRLYSLAKQRLILLDYDGVLVSLRNEPTNSHPSIRLLRLLHKMGADKKTDLIIVSGRGRNDLMNWLDDIPAVLAAEHGALVREAGRRRWIHNSDYPDSWIEDIKPVLEEYATYTPGASVEKKEATLVWHYRNARPYLGQRNTLLLKRTLKSLTKSLHINVYSGNKILEIKPEDVSKGKFTKKRLGMKDYDFVMAIGDDYTDEDTFAALPAHGVAIKVGRGRTKAPYRLKATSEVYNLLKRFV